MSRWNRLLVALLLTGWPAGVSANDDKAFILQGTAGEVASEVSDAREAQAGSGKSLSRGNPGPWGDLEYQVAFLQAPDSLIELLPVPSKKTVWRFPGLKKSQVVELIGKCDPGAVLETDLLKEAYWDANSANETRFFPSPEVILSLSAEARGAIYRELCRWRENSYHWSPLIVEAGAVSDWFEGSGLRG